MRFVIKTFLVLVLFSCDKGNIIETTPQTTGEWYQESDVELTGRCDAVSFVINDSVYIFGGFRVESNHNETFKDLYVYNTEKDTWRKRASMPSEAPARRGAVAFVVNGKAYVGLGLAEDSVTYLGDFWSYNPKTNEWSQIADFSGNPRIGAMAFTIGNSGYVGDGRDKNLSYKDFYEYNEDNNTWEQRPSIPFTGRSFPFSFVINGKGYVGGGRDSNGSASTDFNEFDPTKGESGQWLTKNDLQDDNKDSDANDAGYSTLTRDKAVSFVIGGKGYIVGGTANSETWQYDPNADRWYKMNSFEGAMRYSAIGYTDGKFGYVATGVSAGGTTYLSDKWKYDSDAVDN